MWYSEWTIVKTRKIIDSNLILPFDFKLKYDNTTVPERNAMPLIRCRYVSSINFVM